jgi:hypothetical protein
METRDGTTVVLVGRSRNMLIAACATSAGLHAGLVPEHLGEEPRLGIAFVVATLLLLALTVALRTGIQPQLSSTVAAATLAALIVAYVLSRTAGLPWLEEDAEPFDVVGVLTQGIQGAGLLAALSLCHGTGATASTLRKEVSCT